MGAAPGLARPGDVRGTLRLGRGSQNRLSPHGPLARGGRRVGFCTVSCQSLRRFPENTRNNGSFWVLYPLRIGQLLSHDTLQSTSRAVAHSRFIPVDRQLEPATLLAAPGVWPIEWAVGRRLAYSQPPAFARHRVPADVPSGTRAYTGIAQSIIGSSAAPEPQCATAFRSGDVGERSPPSSR